MLAKLQFIHQAKEALKQKTVGFILFFAADWKCVSLASLGK